MRVVDKCTITGDVIIMGKECGRVWRQKNMIMHVHYVTMLLLLSSLMIPGVKVMGHVS